MRRGEEGGGRKARAYPEKEVEQPEGDSSSEMSTRSVPVAFDGRQVFDDVLSGEDEGGNESWDGAEDPELVEGGGGREERTR